MQPMPDGPKQIRPVKFGLAGKYLYMMRSKDTEPHTVVCKSGVVACWHPERSFPYEHSKPIDLKKIETEKQSSGALNKEIECIADLQGSLSRTGPRNYLLREIFYTGKHEWYTRHREERLRSVAAPDPKRQK
ncbi:unnamed protein product [Onchocerca ochengi]|uniref:Large ribosomal subunit protein mL42 n=1 Tax=Onchocerca ochengi TaxID=42157 RepID=A0A182DXK5_ONCOC|nr:unnamed protein product [Onchocerca ochengi]